MASLEFYRKISPKSRNMLAKDCSKPQQFLYVHLNMKRYIQIIPAGPFFSLFFSSFFLALFFFLSLVAVFFKKNSEKKKKHSQGLDIASKRTLHFCRIRIDSSVSLISVSFLHGFNFHMKNKAAPPNVSSLDNSWGFHISSTREYMRIGTLSRF